MSMNNKGLGRGLDALFNVNPLAQAEDPGASGSPLMNISINALESNPFQPRMDFPEDKLAELADSIRSEGLLQPILVRPAAREGFFQIVAGERRWRAARMAGLAEIPALCRDMDDKRVMVATLVENIQRDALNPIEEARGMLAIKEALDASLEELVGKVGKSKAYISYSLRLLKLDPETQEAIGEGAISPSVARLLLGIDDPAAVIELRDRIIDGDLSYRDVEEAAAMWKEERAFPWSNSEGGAKPEKPKLEKDPEIGKLAIEIGAALNCKAKINGDSERGRISLKYESNAQLYDLLEKLGLSLNS